MATEIRIRGPLLASKSYGGERLVVIGFLEDEDTFLDLRATRWKTKLPIEPAFYEGDLIDVEDRPYLVEMVEGIPAISLQDFDELREAATKEGFMILGDRVYGFRYKLRRC